MFSYPIRRLNLFVITLLILTLVSYSIAKLEPDSYYNQFNYWFGWLAYLSQIVEGNWGMTADGVPAFETLKQTLPATLELCLLAFILSLIIGIPLGTWAGVQRGYASDFIISSVTLLSFSVPIFWLALLLVVLFSYHLDWLPVSGRYQLPFDIPSVTGIGLIDAMLLDHENRSLIIKDIVRHLIMPTLVLAVVPTTEIIKLMRDSVSNVMKQNYVKAAATKGLTKHQIIRLHVLKNALPPVIPKFGLQISTMMTFAIITESIFNWPGIGSWLLQSLNLEDYVSVQAGVLSIGATVLFTSILFELLGDSMSPLARKEWYANQQ